MKKNILAIVIAFTLLFSFQSVVLAQGDCSFACSVPGTPQCNACLNSQGSSVPGASGASGDSIMCGSNGINTAIGCINVLGGPDAFLGSLLKWGVGVGSGFAFLLIVYAGFMIMSSAGNPERLKAGQELLTSAISGLVLLVFSIFVLNFIGVDILGLGDFGFGQ